MGIHILRLFVTGWLESIALGERFQVKRIFVKPGTLLSLQSHNHRAEHWIVVAETPHLTIGEEVRMVKENSQSMSVWKRGTTLKIVGSFP
jgi:mannose-6-phosphate isomerase-like protein (cupin superfamily)